jgi:hypothetical protein
MPTPLERYQAAAARLLAQSDRLTDRQVDSLLRLLIGVRRDVLADLSEIAMRGNPGTFEAYQLRDLRSAIDRQATDLIAKFRPLMGGALDVAWSAGEEYQPQLLDSIGVDLSFREVSRAQLLMARELSATLVTQVSDTFKAAANRAVTLGVMGRKSPMQIMREVGELLRVEPSRQDPGLGSIAYQAERIVRTEMNGAYSLANLARQNQIAEDVPGLRKYWLSVDDGRTRAAHLAAWYRYRPGGTEGPIPQTAKFTVGGEKCDGPHDPVLKAASRINCRCRSLLWSPDWEAE